jgi:membrane peptidoglycan carboxypeptidase
MRAQSVRWRIARKHLQPRRTHRARWIFAVAFTLLLLISGGGGAGAMLFVSRLPSATHFHIAYAYQNARIFDVRGHLLYNMADLSKNGGRRVVEPLQALHDPQPACRGGVNRIPLLLQNATIATEDATFYTNPGFDAMSIVRAALQDWQSGHIVSGASTITQQVVRAAHLVSDRQTINRKVNEVWLAYQISKKFSKRKILWYYLNSVPYGNEAVGAQAAAETYFGVSACRLDAAQTAFLAGLPRAPSLYNPVTHRARALARMRQVLGLMKKHGYLHFRWQIKAAMSEASYWHFSPPHPSIRYPQFVRYVINQIKRMPRLNSQLYNGIDVYTTLDPRLQNLAQRDVTNQIASLTAQHVTDGALVSLDLRPQHYGWILAMVGSANYRATAGQINMAISPRQPGSSMKPFNYIYAFTHGAYPGTTVVDDPIDLPDPNNTQDHGWYSPQNYDHQFHGQVTLRQALANSLNVPAVKVEYYITGSDHVAATAHRFGMTSLYKDNPGLACNVCYSVTLGGLARGTRLLEETAAYGVFASGGQTVPPLAIWKVIKRSTHQVLFCSADCPRGVKPAPWIARWRHQVLDPAHAFEMTDVLADNNARCTPQVCEFGPDSPLLLSRPAAAKTGTTNAFTDNWTVGYTPQIVTGVWVGNADRTPMVNVIGITGAAPIWHDFMEKAFHILRLPVETFHPPPTITTTTQCTVENATPSVTSGIVPLPTPTSTIPTTSAYTSNGFSDIYVQTDKLPLCRIPEKGFMPVSCADYPKPLPLGWQCPGTPGETYTYRLNPDGTYTYTYTNPGTGSSQSYTTTSPPGSNTGPPTSTVPNNTGPPLPPVTNPGVTPPSG